MKKAILIILVVLLAMPLVNAASILGESCSENADFDPKTFTECSEETRINEGISLLADSSDYILGAVKESTGSHKDIRTKSDQFQKLKAQITAIAGAVILLAITYSGLMWIMSSTDPKKRNKAKEQMIASIYMLIFMTASYYIADLVFDVGHTSASMMETDIKGFMANDPWDDIVNQDMGGEDDLTASNNKFKSLFSVSPMFIFTGWVYLILMYLRNMIVVLLNIMAPLLVVFFFFKPTKPFGSVLFTLYVVELFIPFLFFPVFKVAETMFTGDAMTDIGIMASALGAAAILHVVLVVVAVMKSATLRWGED